MASARREQAMRTSERSFHARYYTQTAHLYQQMHVSDGDEHATALRYLGGFLDTLRLVSILDVGTGTGRAIAFVRENNPRVHAVGTELIAALLSQAVEEGQLPPTCLVRGSGYDLPFADKSFDAVCEFGMLHHVKDPNAVIDEMIRVARSAIFLSDSNRFGQGRMFGRYMKLMLARAGLWRAANYLKSGGRAYMISEGDGLSYSYSVFDSFDKLAAWADRVVVVPTSPAQSGTWLHPLLTSSHVLM